MVHYYFTLIIYTLLYCFCRFVLLPRVSNLGYKLITSLTAS